MQCCTVSIKDFFNTHHSEPEVDLDVQGVGHPRPLKVHEHGYVEEEGEEGDGNHVAGQVAPGGGRAGSRKKSLESWPARSAAVKQLFALTRCVSCTGAGFGWQSASRR